MRSLVVTTINEPNKVLCALARGAEEHDRSFIVVGDTKTPANFLLPPAEYVSIAEQEKRYPDLCRVLPTKHYARKNIGYLVAIAQGSAEIQETDDDNFPYPEFWQETPESLDADSIAPDSSCAWFNVYDCYSDARIWPRGFPLQYLHRVSARQREVRSRTIRGLILQGLADGNPDVDAVYRLTRELPLDFRRRKPVFLEPGVWCPFNSQNTTFRREAFPLLYLPSQCSFRMTDIWRSLVAQRCLWESGDGVVFHHATVYQERNDHDLLRDFADEVPGFLMNDRIRCVLEACKLDKGDLLGSLSVCYEALVREALIPETELPIIAAWCAALEKLLD